MFKSQKQNNKPSPSPSSGERVDFRFSNFQALQVPKGWDRLSLSVVSTGTGKVIAKLGKAMVRAGNCQWPETLLESVWIPRDDSSTEVEEYLYKCVVSMGSARSGILGEATMNLASYLSSRSASPVSLPLKKCNYGIILQVKIHCLTPRTKLRDEESNGSHSLVKEQSLDYHDSGRNSNVSSSLLAAGNVGIHDSGFMSRPGKFDIQERSFSPSVSFEKGFCSVDKLLLKNHLRSEASKHQNGHTEEISENNSPRDSFLFEDRSASNRPSLNQPGVMSIMEKNLQHYGKDLAVLTNSGSSKKLLEAAEDTIEELRVEAKMWERNARKLMLDLDILKNEFSNQSKKQADLVMELSAAYAEHDSLKREIENLKLILEESSAAVKQATLEDSTFQTKRLTQIHEELENEIKHQQELSNSLALQLKRSQESNIDLVSVLQELEETIEQQKVEIENLSDAEKEYEHKLSVKEEEIARLEAELQKLEDYSMKFQENKDSKAELEVQCTNLQKELSEKRSEVDRLKADFLKKEEETNILMQHRRELDTKVADLQKKRDQLEEDLEIMSGENSSSSRCLDDLQNKLKILGENNEILQRKSEEIECDNRKLENQLTKLKEENLYLQSQMKCIATDRDSCHLKLDNSRSVAKKLKGKIMELEMEMENKVAGLKQNLENAQNQQSEAQRECEHLKEEKQKLEESIENLLEEVKILEKSNSELRAKNVEMQEYCVQVDDRLKKSEKSLYDSCYNKVETLEEKLNSMIKDFSLKEENFKTELDELVRENEMQMEKLAQQEVSSQEKLNEIESLQKQVEHLTTKISAMNEENERAANEISSLQADKARMQGVLEGIQSKVSVTENELNTVRKNSELKVQGLMIELAGSKQSYEKLMSDHEKTLKLLTSYRTTEEKLKTSMNDLELKLTISQCEHQQLLEDTVNLKFQLQKITELQDEILDLRNQLHECRNEKEKLEASMQMIFGEMKSENFSFHDKISTLKEAVLVSENCKREKVSLEEKLLQMEYNLTEREVQNEGLGTELTKIKRENKLYQQKIHQLEEENKQNCRKTGENGHGFHDGVPNDTTVCIEKIKLLESKLAETLEANKKFKIQLQRFRSEERKTQGASSKRAIAENELAERERFEQQTKSSLEAELKDIRERYFEMSLKYAEVEAQRETLVMKLKTAKNGKKRSS
nr:putative leucine-rich repeat-containing protein DDB_G0290503 [Ipomoea trifida]